ncbi:MAG TPA: hypothetical protein VJ742_09575 [Nitrososphaera sp.]|nr:hypothetical protein [Nitrososphaera sp.]
MVRSTILALAVIALIFQIGQADAHFFGETKQVDNYQIIFMPYPTFPVAGSNSTYLNFSFLDNGSNIFNIYSALVITQKNSETPIEQLPYRLYEFSDISIPYAFAEPGDYTVTLQTRITGDEKYQAVPLEATFELTVDTPNRQGIPIDELMLFYVTPAAVAIAGIAIYMHSKRKR